jgi:hypothetical protein
MISYLRPIEPVGAGTAQRKIPRISDIFMREASKKRPLCRQ